MNTTSTEGSTLVAMSIRTASVIEAVKQSLGWNCSTAQATTSLAERVSNLADNSAKASSLSCSVAGSSSKAIKIPSPRASRPRPSRASWPRPTLGPAIANVRASYRNRQLAQTPSGQRARADTRRPARTTVPAPTYLANSRLGWQPLLPCSQIMIASVNFCLCFLACLSFLAQPSNAPWLSPAMLLGSAPSNAYHREVGKQAGGHGPLHGVPEPIDGPVGTSQEVPPPIRGERRPYDVAHADVLCWEGPVKVGTGPEGEHPPAGAHQHVPAGSKPDDGPYVMDVGLLGRKRTEKVGVPKGEDGSRRAGQHVALGIGRWGYGDYVVHVHLEARQVAIEAGAAERADLAVGRRHPVAVAVRRSCYTHDRVRPRDREAKQLAGGTCGEHRSPFSRQPVPLGERRRRRHDLAVRPRSRRGIARAA